MDSFTSKFLISATFGLRGKVRLLRLYYALGVVPVAKNPVKSAGCVSKRWLPSGSTTQGCALRVQKCTVGRSQEVSSSVPARTVRIAEPALGAAQIHEPHSGQTQRVATRPVSVVRWSPRGSAPVRRKASDVTTNAIENAL